MEEDNDTNNEVMNANDDSNDGNEYGRPALLSESELEAYPLYLHFSEASTTKLRNSLKELHAEQWEDTMFCGVHQESPDSDPEFVAEVKHKNGIHAFQIRLKKDEFRIFHYSPSNEPMCLPIDFLMMRIGGALRDGTEGLKAFPKAEVRLYVDEDDEVDFG